MRFINYANVDFVSHGNLDKYNPARLAIKICSPNNVLYFSFQEKEALIRDFQPEPLVTDVPLSHPAIRPRIIRGKVISNIDLLK